MHINWRSVFVPTMSLLELVFRGVLVYLVIFAALRIRRREAGALGTADMLVVVLVADAAQNGMASEYNSVTEAVVLVATIFGMNYFLDWLAFRYPWAHKLLVGSPLLLVKNGQIQRKNLRTEMLTKSDLMEQLREQGIDDLSKIKQCCLEADGKLSVIRNDEEEPAQEPKKVLT